VTRMHPLAQGAKRLVENGWFVLVLAICLHGGYAVLRGVILASDTATYSRWANELIASGFSIGSFLANSPVAGTRIFYVGFVSVVAILKQLSGENWPVALVLLNILCSAIVGLLVVRLVLGTTNSLRAGWVALGLHLLAFEVFGWVPYALSDISFLGLSFGSFILASRMIRSDRTHDRWFSATALLVLFPLALLFRPTGMALVPGLVLAAAIALSGSRPVVRALLAVLLCSAIAAMLLTAWIVQEPSRWPTDRLSSAIEAQSREYASGQIVRDRPDTYHSPPVTYLDNVLITADRFMHFFRFTIPAFSWEHNAFNVAFFVPVYLLAGFTLIGVARHRLALSPGGRSVVLVSAVVVFSYAVFHSLTQVDYDWRYRVPVIPHLVFLAAVAIAAPRPLFWSSRRKPIAESSGDHLARPVG
jgi:hypothetical protein